MILIELQTLPKKGEPARTYCTFEIPPTTTVAQFLVLASEKAGQEIRLDGPNVVKGLRKFKLTGQPEQPIQEALTPIKSTATTKSAADVIGVDQPLDPALADDIGHLYVAELKSYVQSSQANLLSQIDGPCEWTLAGLPADADEEDEDFEAAAVAFRCADGTWNKQRLVDALLSAAASAGDASGVKAALRRGAQVDSQPYHAVGAGTALHMALNAEVAALLLQAHADIDARDGRHGLPITRALRFGRFDTAIFLIQSGAALEFTLSGEPDTALRFVHIAAHVDDRKRDELTRQLILHKANVNFHDRDGWSALMEAAIHGNLSIGRLLLEAGADIHHVAEVGPNEWGRVTALDVCRKNGFGELAAELESRGAMCARDTRQWNMRAYYSCT